MKKIKLLIALCVLTWASCWTDKNSTEYLPLNDEKLVAVLCDLQVAEAIPDGEMPEIKDSLMRVYSPQIFTKHGISAADFDTTMSRLARQPLHLEQVYKKVSEQLKNEASK